MEDFNRPLGCGLWLVWLFLALFAAEWLLLWLAMHKIPKEWLLPGIVIIVAVTVAVGWIVVFIRVQRRAR